MSDDDKAVKAAVKYSQSLSWSTKEEVMSCSFCGMTKDEADARKVALLQSKKQPDKCICSKCVLSIKKKMGK